MSDPLARNADATRAGELSGWVRYLSLAGIIAVVLWVVGVLTIDSVRPAGTPNAEQILAYYQDHGDTVGLAVYGFMLGSLLFLVFVGALWSRLREVDGQGSPLAAIVLGAGIATSIGLLVFYGSDLEAALDRDAITASTAEAYYYFGDFWWLGAEMMAAVMIAATGIVVLRTRMFPRWLGVASLFVALWLLIPPIGWIAMFLIFPAWVIIVSVLLTPRFARPVIATRRNTSPAEGSYVPVVGD
jgi:hypothetical protein